MFSSQSPDSLGIAGARDKMAPFSQRQMRGSPHRALGCIKI
jgi:hypothetical protein